MVTFYVINLFPIQEHVITAQQLPGRTALQSSIAVLRKSNIDL